MVSTSNSNKLVKNSLISVMAQAILLLLQFINRRVFVEVLSLDYLGYQSVFCNIFNLLSVAELGIGNIISYQLYRELNNNNKEEIIKLMEIYKYVYRIIAGVVGTAGGVIAFFLPVFVTGISDPWSFLYKIYFLQLFSTILGYFLSYKRTIYIADQKEYKCVQIDLYTNLIVQGIQLALLIVFRNYFLYLIIQLSITFISNIIISYNVNKDYPYLKTKVSVTKQDINKRKLVPDVKNMLVHKISYAVFSGTDNLVISAFCGVRDVAMYSNYFSLQTGVMQLLFYKMLNPVQATIGNIVYSGRKKVDIYNQFLMLDVFSFFFASYIAIGFLIFFQPAITFWMGSQYLLPFSFVIVFSIYIYFGAVWEIVYKYRLSFGNYDKDRNYMILSAVFNIIISISLAKVLGVTGVEIGTLISFFFIAYGRIKFVVRGYFGKSQWLYIGKHFFLFLIVVTEGVISVLLTKSLPVNVIGILLRVLVWLVIPGLFGVIVFFRSKYFKEMLQYLKRMVGMIKKRKL